MYLILFCILSSAPLQLMNGPDLLQLLCSYPHLTSDEPSPHTTPLNSITIRQQLIAQLSIM